MDYKCIWARVEEAHRDCTGADDFLLEILRIWSEFGLIQGDWACSLEKAG
jgi:hypothetical protein